jgi:hypothetical protein
VCPDQVWVDGFQSLPSTLRAADHDAFSARKFASSDPHCPEGESPWTNDADTSRPKGDYARRVLGMKRSHPNYPHWEEWIKQQPDKFPALTEERWAKIAAIVAGSRQRAMDRIDQFDRSA